MLAAPLVAAHRVATQAVTAAHRVIADQAGMAVIVMTVRLVVAGGRISTVTGQHAPGRRLVVSRPIGRNVARSTGLAPMGERAVAALPGDDSTVIDRSVVAHLVVDLILIVAHVAGPMGAVAMIGVQAAAPVLTVAPNPGFGELVLMARRFAAPEVPTRVDAMVVHPAVLEVVLAMEIGLKAIVGRPTAIGLKAIVGRAMEIGLKVIARKLIVGRAMEIGLKVIAPGSEPVRSDPALAIGLAMALARVSNAAVRLALADPTPVLTVTRVGIVRRSVAGPLGLMVDEGLIVDLQAIGIRLEDLSLVSGRHAGVMTFGRALVLRVSPTIADPPAGATAAQIVLAARSRTLLPAVGVRVSTGALEATVRAGAAPIVRGSEVTVSRATATTAVATTAAGMIAAGMSGPSVQRKHLPGRLRSGSTKGRCVTQLVKQLVVPHGPTIGVTSDVRVSPTRSLNDSMNVLALVARRSRLRHYAPLRLRSTQSGISMLGV